MAIVNNKSTVVTNADATPITKSNDYQANSEQSSLLTVATLLATDTATSTYRFARIPSGACIQSVRLAAPANTSSAASIGVRETAANGGGLAAGVANSDKIFAQTVNIAAGLAVLTELLAPALASVGTASNANYGLRVWELLGLSADPYRDYDIVLTQTTAGTTAAAGSNYALTADFAV
jgi:hypothetical protein